jgi:hypothetical protein
MLRQNDQEGARLLSDIIRLGNRGIRAPNQRLLHGYNLAYNARRQRVLDGQSPDQVVQARLEAKPELANPAYQPPSPCDRTKTKIAAQLTVYSAKDVSHPDTCRRCAGRRA